jgi:hypothetical protein
MQKSYECEVATHIGSESGYYGVPMNQPALFLLPFQVGRLWYRALSRRSQNGRILWDRMRRLITRWLPMPSVCHSYPLRRMASSPKARAGCGSAACPDPWRGCERS